MDRHPVDAPPAPAAEDVRREAPTTTAPGQDHVSIEAAAGLHPPDASGRDARTFAAAAGVVPPDLTLPDAAAWTRFVETWQEASQDVAVANAARHKLGRALAKQRFADGKYEEILVDESQRVDGGFSTEQMTALRHADEWVALQMLGRERGACFHVVRIPPGDDPKLDEVTQELRLAERRRKDAIDRFLALEKSQRGR